MGNTCVLRANHDIVRPGEPIEVSYDLSRRDYISGSCWIGLIPVDGNEDAVSAEDVSYLHVRSERGKCKLCTSTVGAYYIKCFAKDIGGAHVHIGTMSRIIYVFHNIKPTETSFAFRTIFHNLMTDLDWQDVLISDLIAEYARRGLHLTNKNVQMHAEINQLTQHADDEIRRFGQEMSSILKAVQTAQQDSQKSQWEISQTKINVDNSNTYIRYLTRPETRQVFLKLMFAKCDSITGLYKSVHIYMHDGKWIK